VTGAGSFGSIFLGVNLKGEQCAIKREEVDSHHPQLRHEYKVYRELRGCEGFAHAMWFGTEVYHLISSHPTISSYLFSSHLISSHPISPYLIPLSRLISSHLISSYLISSHLTSSHPISSHLIASYLISSHRDSSHHIMSSHFIQGDFNYLMVDLMGHSLEDLFNQCGRVFSLKTVVVQ
jgi:hypothetical protein